jgi:hypothetical protein
MKITQVHYQKLVNLGDYQNERVGAWATVEDGEAPEEALATLTAWVEEQAETRHSQEDEIQTARGIIAGLDDQKRSLTRETQEMRETWRKGRAFLKAIGLELPRSYVKDIEDQDMPF